MSIIVSASAMKLAGFLMAHAVWIVSDLAKHENYVPQALCEVDGERQLFVFEAETQVEAIAQGKQFMTDGASAFDRCAFARIGEISQQQGLIDVVVVDVVEKGGSAQVTTLQPIRNERGLRLAGDEILAISGRALTYDEISTLRASLRAGAASHDGAADLWKNLSAHRLPRPDALGD